MSEQSEAEATSRAHEVELEELRNLQDAAEAKSRDFHEAISARNKAIARAALELGFSWREIYSATGLAQSRQNQIIAENS